MPSASTTPPAYTLLTADRVIDAKGGPPIQNGAVLTCGSEIVSVGPAHEIRAPDGASVNHHHYPAHRSFPAWSIATLTTTGSAMVAMVKTWLALEDEILTVQAAGNARRSLFSGVTTIRENGPKNMTMFRLAGRHQ